MWLPLSNKLFPNSAAILPYPLEVPVSLTIRILVVKSAFHSIHVATCYPYSNYM